jgi:hypothetical protein
MAKEITEAVTEHFLMLSVAWTTTGKGNLTLYCAIHSFIHLNSMYPDNPDQLVTSSLYNVFNSLK